MRKIAAVGVFTAGILGADDADARGIRGGEARLGISTTLLGFTSIDNGNGSIDVQSIGLGANSLGLQLGYATGPHFEIGGLLSYASDTLTAPDGGGESSASSALIGPYIGVNYPTPNSALYVEGFVAYVSMSGDATIGADSFSLDGSGFHYGIGGGIKIFVLEKGSIDLGMRLFSQSIDVDAGGGDTVTISQGGFLLTAGMSLWFGGNPPPPPEDEETREYRDPEQTTEP